MVSYHALSFFTLGLIAQFEASFSILPCQDVPNQKDLHHRSFGKLESRKLGSGTRSALSHDGDVTYRYVDSFRYSFNVTARQATMASPHSEQVHPPCPGLLHDSTRKLFPCAFLIMFVITGTVVLVYTLSLHQPVPPNFMTGAAITFGVLITLMLIGHFSLYVRKQLSLIRSASGSERSIIIEGEREAWNVRLRNLLDECEDMPRRLLREFALRRKLKRNPKKGLINTVNQNQELPRIDPSQSEVNHGNPDPTPAGTAPVYQSHYEIDLENGEHPGQQTPCRDLGITILDVAEATSTRSAPNISIGTKSHAEITYDPEHLEHTLAGSSKISRISTTSRRNSLSGTYQGMRSRRSPSAHAKKTRTMRTRARKLVHPDKELIKHYSQFSSNHERHRSSRARKHYEVDSGILSQASEENTAHHSTFHTHEEERLADVQLYHFESPQQQIHVSHFVYGTTDDGKSAIALDQVKTDLMKSQDNCHSKVDHITTGFRKTQSSNTSPYAKSIWQSDKTTELGTLDSYTSDIPLRDATPNDESESFKCSTSTCCQTTAGLYISSLEVGPQIPAYRGSSASGFTSGFMYSINGIYDSEDEQHEAHSATAMTLCDVPGKNELPSEEAHLKEQQDCGAGD